MLLAPLGNTHARPKFWGRPGAFAGHPEGLLDVRLLVIGVDDDARVLLFAEQSSLLDALTRNGSRVEPLTWATGRVGATPSAMERKPTCLLAISWRIDTMDTLVPAILGLVGVVIGVMAAWGGQYLAERSRRKDNLRYSARIIRDDIVAAMEATHSAIDETRWWPVYLDPTPLSTIDDWRLLAARLGSGEDVRRVFGCQRRFRQLRAQRRTALQSASDQDLALATGDELACVEAFLDLAEARRVLSELADYGDKPFQRPIYISEELEKQALENVRLDKYLDEAKYPENTELLFVHAPRPREAAATSSPTALKRSSAACARNWTRERTRNPARTQHCPLRSRHPKVHNDSVYRR
ncbi:MAG: hypothetical protein JWR48_7213 [Mycobacterium sp.]|nr:hypothetical protein [Mycobacterium sp.]